MPSSSQRSVELYDTTLRDGNQSVGVNFTVSQKVRVARELLEGGLDYVEAGWPNETNPTDLEFFKLARSLDKTKFAQISAFGMTCHAGFDPADDPNILQLLEADSKIVTIFGKSWTFQVEKVLKTTLEENRRIVFDSVRFLKSKGRKVIFDAEHFFDGFTENPEYATSILRAAKEAGASALVLCDTRGGSYPSEVYEATKCMVNMLRAPIGIHAHNDRGLATANSLFAVMAGASHVQGTINGLGERVGNADLIEVTANLNLMHVCTRLSPLKLFSLSRFVFEMSGLRENPFKPFVGKHAFAHKGGVHGDAVLKTEKAYEFIDPSAFGNTRAITVSSQAGRASLLAAARKLEFKISKNDERLTPLLREIKRLESLGCNLENARASLELLVRRYLSREREPFHVMNWEASIRNNFGKPSALCKVLVDFGGKPLEASAEGNGPVNAFDQALRLVLKKHFSSQFSARLTGYRVKEIDSEAGTAAKVAVYIDFTGNHRTWTTVASSTNIIQASINALADGYSYGLTARNMPQKKIESRDN